MRRLVRELCKEKLNWNSFTLLEIVQGFSLTQASWSPVRSEEPESRWRYSSQFSLLRTYSAITAPRTPACINKTEYGSIAASCLESINLRACESFQLTIQAQSAVGQAVKSLGADWPGLCSDEWYHTKSAMHLTASVLGKNQTNNNHIWTLSLMNGFVVNDSNCTLLKTKIFVKFQNYEILHYLFIPLRVNELYESLGQFLFIQPLLRKILLYN